MKTKGGRAGVGTAQPFRYEGVRRLRTSDLWKRVAAEWMTTPGTLVPAIIAGLWPVWRWYVARMSDGSDEPVGLLALGAAVFFLPRRGWLKPVGATRLTMVAAVLAVYFAAFDLVPPLVRACLAMTALVFAFPREPRRSMLPLYALMVLSLPVIASLQYFLGFPVRAATTWVAAHLLSLTGLAVEARGTVLRWAGQEILIDAPCSGVRMLWTAACLSSVLGAAYRLRARRFIQLAQLTGAIVFVANLARSIVLFLLETNLWPNPRGAHDAVGIAAFALAAGACVLAADRLRRQTAREPSHIARRTRHEEHFTATHEHRAARGLVTTRRLGAAVVISLALASGARALIAETNRAVTPTEAHAQARSRGVPWPATLEGRPLERAALLPVEQRFSENFPGEFAAFTDGEGRRVVFRRIDAPTRMMHPASDCLRAAGFSVHPTHAQRYEESGLRAVIDAAKDGARFVVREHITDGAGRVWTDVSAWYWSALMRPSSGPWMATTVIETATRD